jgi:hypothetical protein
MFSPSSIGLQVLDGFGRRRMSTVRERLTVRRPDRQFFSHKRILASIIAGKCTESTATLD